MNKQSETCFHLNDIHIIYSNLQECPWNIKRDIFVKKNIRKKVNFQVYFFDHIRISQMICIHLIPLGSP